jgi:two-component system, OmpR family, manganese sensing sensor histidine kinase
MFQQIQRRLLLSYLLVLATILITFAIAVRIVFARSLYNQLIDKLTALGQGAATNAEFEGDRIKIESDFPIQALIDRQQGLQWFDLKGRLISQQGKSLTNLPFSKSKAQLQTGKPRLQSVTLPIINSDEGRLIGYVRVSQSLEEVDETINKLDWGLGGGIFIALALSGVGGVWLTRQAMQPIEQSFQRLKQFTADASHELRSPLMVVKSNAAVALKYAEGMRETDAEKFAAIASATNQMTQLTEDLLFLARNDRIPAKSWEKINLTVILENLVQQYKPQAIAKQINLQVQITENIYLIGDPVQLTRVFTNLIENALNYTLAGGAVEIKTRHNITYLEIEVKDTGVGIALEDIDKVFERFWRGDRARSYNSGGSGLGLAIAGAIAQNHGGYITVTSVLAKGSCFTVYLPRVK